MADIENFVNAMIDKDHVKSNQMFADLIGQKVDAAIEAEKISVASQVFNNAEPEETDLSDEELEMELADDVEELELDDAEEVEAESEELEEYEFDDENV